MGEVARHWLLGSALASGVLAAAPWVAPPAGAETLAETLATAYATSPRLDARRRELGAVDEQIGIACGGYRPQLFARGSAAYVDLRTEAVNNVTRNENNKSGTVSIGVEQNLYQGGGTMAAVQSASSQVERAQAVLDFSGQDLLVDAATVYSNVRRDRQVLLSSEGNVAGFEQQLEATQKRLNVGEATRTDLNQAQGRLAQAQAELSQARANLDSSIGSFMAVVGVAPGALEPAGPPDSLPASLDEALALVDNNPEVVAAQARLAQAEAEIDVARANLLPSLDAEASLSYEQDPDFITDNQREGRIGLFLTVPLYQGGGEYAAVRQQRQVRLQRQQELAETRRTVADRINLSYQSYVAAGQRIERFHEQIAAAELALDGVKREVQIGTRLIVDILNAQQELFGAQVNLERAIRDRVVGGYDLLGAIGELTPVRLGLDPAVHDVRVAAAVPGCRFFDIGTSIE